MASSSQYIGQHIHFSFCVLVCHRLPLGAVDGAHVLTEDGKKVRRGLISIAHLARARSESSLLLRTDVFPQMAQFPLEPRQAKAILGGSSLHCTEEIINIVSMLSVENIFFSPHQRRDEADKARKRFASGFGDHLTLLNVYREYKVM